MVGQWTVEPALNKISCVDNQITLVPKVMAILLALVEGEGEPLSLSALMAIVWKQQVVSDSSVYQAIAQLRKALGDTASEPTYIERVSGKGYRLIAPVSPISTLINQDKTQTINSAPQAISTSTWDKPAKAWFVNWHLWLAAVIVVIVVSVLVLYKPWQKPEHSLTPLSIANISSISLERLNTENLGQATNLEALNDVLLTQLMQIKQMRVVSSSQHAKSLSTQAVIKGTIHKQDNSIRVFLQIVQTGSQQVIWAKAFNGQVDDLFILQDTIVETLLVLFKQQQTQTAFNAASIDNRSFDQYLLARHLWQQRSGSALHRAKSIYEEMQRKKKLFPLAAVGLCDTYHYLHIYSDWSLKKVLNECRPLLKQALLQQPDLGQAIAAQAMLLSSQGKKVEAEKLFKKAIKLAPNYPFAYMWYAEMNRWMGEYKQSLAMTQTAYAMAPMSPMINRSLAYAYLNSGDKKQARFYYRRALDLQFDYTNRAVEELNFLPITTDRARAFLTWAKAHPQVIRKRRSYQLTQAQIELALGNSSAVAETLSKLQNKQVNPSFKLFIQTSLAASQRRYEDVIGFIKQRIDMHHDNARYAGAYLLALELMGDDEQAYDVFLQLLPKLAHQVRSRQASAEIAITAENRNLLAFYVQLQARRKKMDLVTDLAQQLDNSFSQRGNAQNIYYARWLLFRGEQEKAQNMILAMMNNGWLPDYNAYLYPEAIMKQLFINLGLGEKKYQSLIARNRAQVVPNLD